MGKAVFFSFHYDRDVHRVQLVRNINALEGQPLLDSQQWEQVRKKGTAGIEEWINREMAYKKAVIVLVGRETASRPWVKYEIEKAWAARKPLLGVRIHGLSSMGETDAPGKNPFEGISDMWGVPLFDPTVKDWRGQIDSQATYNVLKANLEGWSDQGMAR